MTSYEYRCGSPVCSTHFTEPTKQALLDRVLVHVDHKHHIPVPTKSILQFVVENTVHEIDDSRGAGS